LALSGDVNKVVLVIMEITKRDMGLVVRYDFVFFDNLPLISELARLTDRTTGWRLFELGRNVYESGLCGVPHMSNIYELKNKIK